MPRPRSEPAWQVARSSLRVQPDHYDALVLQGGGCRCFFTLGFLETAGSALSGLRQIAAVSAATAMACAHLIDSHRHALGIFARLVRQNRRNFHVEKLLRGENPMPHYGLYRQALLEAFSDEAFARLRAAPTRLRVVVSRVPSRSLAVAVGLGAWFVWRKQPPPLLQVNVIEAHELTSAHELADAVLASSAFPPFTPVPRRADHLLIDGGAVAPVPHQALDPEQAQRPLFILTRPEPVWPMPAGSHYIAPETELDVATWDYSSESALRRVYEAGLRQGEHFIRAPRVWLYP
ncbi:MAG: patatin-like phospholipase family protein [Myxococcales bacterium]|nr:patatin-like phospholipase family protein [Myxococcales bacterium]